MEDKMCSFHPDRPAALVLNGEGICDGVCMQSVRCPSCADLEVGRHADVIADGVQPIACAIECSQCGHTWVVPWDDVS